MEVTDEAIEDICATITIAICKFADKNRLNRNKCFLDFVLKLQEFEEMHDLTKMGIGE